jgi:DNA primase
MSKPRFVDFHAVKRAVTMVQVLEHSDLMSRFHRNGDSLTGACPIHGGDNPTAFRVSISKNCWNCLSKCGGGGNVLDFVARKEKVTLLKAANLLVEWFRLNLPSPDDEKDRAPGRSREPRQETKPEKATPAQLSVPSPNAAAVEDKARPKAGFCF